MSERFHQRLCEYIERVEEPRPGTGGPITCEIIVGESAGGWIHVRAFVTAPTAWAALLVAEGVLALTSGKETWVRSKPRGDQVFDFIQQRRFGTGYCRFSMRDRPGQQKVNPDAETPLDLGVSPSPAPVAPFIGRSHDPHEH